MIKICSVEGCETPCRNKGINKGKRIYGHRCEKHHKTLGNGTTTVALRYKIDNSVCSQCGWDKGPCDRHRIDPAIGYNIENVKVLCPNCHRLEHITTGSWKDKVDIDD